MEQAKNQSLAKSTPAYDAVTAIKNLTTSQETVQRFKDMLGKKSGQFLASVISAVRGNEELQKAKPNSIMAAAMIAATLDLDINQSLGFAAIVPYKKNKKMPDGSWSSTVEAQFQIMTKGLVQLALRSGQYRNINVVEIYKDEYLGQNLITGDLRYQEIVDGDRDHGRTSNITGYVAYLEFVNGFQKTVYWSLDKIKQHAFKFSQSYDKRTNQFRKGSAWDVHFEAMCKKTVLKNALSSWGILSTQMQQALIEDKDDIQGESEPVPETQQITDTTPAPIAAIEQSADAEYEDAPENSDEPDLDELYQNGGKIA
jgi:recombination protein RecT